MYFMAPIFLRSRRERLSQGYGLASLGGHDFWGGQYVHQRFQPPGWRVRLASVDNAAWLEPGKALAMDSPLNHHVSLYALQLCHRA